VSSRADAILVPGGFGDRGVEGKIEAVRYARENDIPFLGICLGMHVALIEYARNVCGLEGAHSTEMQPDTPHPIVALITEWQNADGSTEQRDESSDLGGTMRLGAQPCHLVEGTRTCEKSTAPRSSGAPPSSLRGQRQLRADSCRTTAWCRRLVRGPSLVEMIELPEHAWFVACQFHPEFTSRPRGGHPLFTSYIQAACQHAAGNRTRR
jgi:CTP synthase